MIFKGIDNQSVELKIKNYSIPRYFAGDWDANWLEIYLKVTSKLGNWRTVEPALITWEVEELIDWFLELAANQESAYNEPEFTEPNLSFELLNSVYSAVKEFRISFELESKPPSATDDEEYFVDCVADNQTLLKIAADLQRELDKYPVREPAPKITMQTERLQWWQKFFSNE